MTHIRIPATPGAAGFTGWIRTPRSPWRAVVQDADQGECFGRLLEYADGLHVIHKDLCVLPSGQHPSARPSRAAVPSVAAVLAV